MWGWWPSPQDDLVAVLQERPPHPGHGQRRGAVAGQLDEAALAAGPGPRHRARRQQVARAQLGAPFTVMWATCWGICQ